jgi:hypothetical protein
VDATWNRAAILEACEREGYAEVERTLIPLPNRVSFPVVKLGKTIPSVEG